MDYGYIHFFNSIFTLLLIIYLGIYYFASGVKYDGEWKNNKYEGKGTISIPNCSLILNLNYGYIHLFNFIFTLLLIIYLGIFYYVNGNKYDGEWKNDKKEGKGTISIPNCSLFLNLDYGYIHFFNSIFTLLFIIYLGIFYFANGDKYDGEYKNDKVEGKGIIDKITKEQYNYLIK